MLATPVRFRFHASVISFSHLAHPLLLTVAAAVLRNDINQESISTMFAFGTLYGVSNQRPARRTGAADGKDFSIPFGCGVQPLHSCGALIGRASVLEARLSERCDV